MTKRKSAKPPLGNLFLELLSPFGVVPFGLSVPWLRSLPGGDGHPVLVLPGLLAGEGSLWALSWFLRSRGYQVLQWGEGRNRGPTPGVFDTALAILKSANRRSGQKVSLVGWSLGGTLARVLANRHPELIRCVVTLAAPHTGDPKATHLNWLYKWGTGHAPGARAAFTREYAPTPEVPLTAVYSRLDGVIPWQAAYQKPGPHTESVKVFCPHGAMATDPMVMYVLADRLAQPEGQWRAFEPRWWFPLSPAPGSTGVAAARD